VEQGTQNNLPLTYGKFNMDVGEYHRVLESFTEQTLVATKVRISN
jgi:hypothetical protein